MVVDFHIHCYDRPLRAPESFVAFMDRELAKSHGSFARFLEPTMKGNIDAIRALALSEGAKERILGGNAARLLKLL